MSHHPPQPVMRFMGLRFDRDDVFGEATILGRVEWSGSWWADKAHDCARDDSKQLRGRQQPA